MKIMDSSTRSVGLEARIGQAPERHQTNACRGEERITAPRNLFAYTYQSEIHVEGAIIDTVDNESE